MRYTVPILCILYGHYYGSVPVFYVGVGMVVILQFVDLVRLMT